VIRIVLGRARCGLCGSVGFGFWFCEFTHYRLHYTITKITLHAITRDLSTCLVPHAQSHLPPRPTERQMWIKVLL
jgi:hypothetical protein